MSDGQILLITIGIMVFFGILFVFFFKVPDSQNYYLPVSSNLDPNLQKLLKVFGPEILGIVPKNLKKKLTKNEELDLLIKKSGNPWNVTVEELLLLRLTLTVLGVILGFIFGSLLGFLVHPLLGVTIGLLLPFVGWIYTTSEYKELAKKRDKAFLKDLPQAIDLLTMALSGGNYTLINGIKETLPHLKEDSPIKTEFETILLEVNAGSTLSQALENFAERVPTPGVQSFTRALINANKKSVDMTEILKHRAKESRKELRAEAETKISALPDKVMGILSPVALFSIGIMLIMPIVKFLMTNM